jgi:DNA-binding CsgD family transcriptional regulator
MKQKLSTYKVHSNYPVSADFQKHFNDFCEIAKSQLGFPGLTIATAEITPFNSPRLICFSNQPEEWMQEYREKKLFAVDPVAQHGFHSTSRLTWNLKTLASAPELQKLAVRYNHNVGIFQSTKDIHGLTHLISLIRSGPEITSEELVTLEPKLSHFVFSIQNLLEVYFSKRRAPLNKLTLREKEMLRWVADGKTAAETASILNISERTVNFHITNCISKLNASNKIQSLLKAVSLNLL